MQRSKFDPNQITQLTFDEKSRSVRTHLVDTAIAIELDHKDGDSVTIHPAKLTASALECTEKDNNKEIIPALDCSSLKKVNVSINGTGLVRVMVSPTDSGNFFYELGGSGMTLDICARRIKVISVNVIGDVHLVGQG